MKTSALALVLASLLACAPAFAAGTVVFRDDFSAGQLDAAKWGVGTWRLGRCQLGNMPATAGGMAQLRFDTYGFKGSEIYTKANFARGNGVEFEARVRMNHLPSGLVSALFTYNTQGALSDELDIEVLSKQVNLSSGGAPLLLSTWNNWDEAHPAYNDGVHNASSTVKVAGLDVNAFHTYVIRWLPTRTEWLVDGVLVASSTKALPDLATPFRLNLWAPASSWRDAYAATLRPARLPRANASYYMDVDWVEIRTLP
ncbi:MAG: glycoside hydrolase family 16 protein [Arenimonas sp.]